MIFFWPVGRHHVVVVPCPPIIYVFKATYPSLHQLYVLVHENDFLAADMRPHGLIELVFGGGQFLFPTFLPRWIN